MSFGKREEGNYGKKELNQSPFKTLKKKWEFSGAYKVIFPETFKLLDILLTLPVGTDSVEHSFSQMKIVKKRIRNRISENNLAKLICIAIYLLLGTYKFHMVFQILLHPSSSGKMALK